MWDFTANPVLILIKSILVFNTKTGWYLSLKPKYLLNSSGLCEIKFSCNYWHYKCHPMYSLKVCVYLIIHFLVLIDLYHLQWTRWFSIQINCVAYFINKLEVTWNFSKYPWGAIFLSSNIFMVTTFSEFNHHFWIWHD